MSGYILKRMIAAIFVLFGVNVITFMLFFMVNSPDDMARAHLGEKNLTKETISRWKQSHGYDLPLFINTTDNGVNTISNTLFFQKSLKLFMFDFGVSDAGRDISDDILQRMWPSLSLAIPILLLGLLTNITFAMLMTFFRSTYVDVWGVILCIILMSISGLFYVIGGQYLIGKMLKILPISGYDPGLSSIKFVILPVLIGVVSGIGASSRWYRTIFLEELNQDYIKTAKSKGVSDLRVFFGHLLKNSMLPILTGVVVIIPTLFMGSLILESFFGVPGLGSYVIDAISLQDFAIVRCMVFLGSILYIIGLILTDISYTIFDPRIRLS